MKRLVWTALAQCRRGATAVEYGLIVALIVLGMFSSLKALANQTTQLWNHVANEMSAAR